MMYEKWYKETIKACKLYVVTDQAAARCKHSMNYNNWCSPDKCPLVKYDS